MWAAAEVDIPRYSEGDTPFVKTITSEAGRKLRSCSRSLAAEKRFAGEIRREKR